MWSLVQTMLSVEFNEFRNHVTLNKINVSQMVHPDTNQNLIFYAVTRPGEKTAYSLLQVRQQFSKLKIHFFFFNAIIFENVKRFV